MTSLTAGESCEGELNPVPKRRDLLGACLAHLLHDGYTDSLYALLPVWQAQFGLSYAGVAAVRALYYGTMGGFQLPIDRATGWLNSRAALVLATLTAAAGYLIAGLPFGFAGLCLGLIIAGIGSSVQHPRASALVTQAYGRRSRGPLGTYNFAGDLGKSILPATVALLLPLIAWQSVTGLMAILGLFMSVALLAVIPAQQECSHVKKAVALGGDGRGFGLLLTIGAFDTAPRMGYLLFLPFLITGKGGSQSTIGIALAALFIGGAMGKAFCGWLGQRLGVIASVVITESLTAALMLLTLLLPLRPTLAVLPILGVVLNGTSSVLYGTVPEMAKRGNVSRAFALFYTGVIGSGGLAPIGYGAIADHSSRNIGVAASALTAVAIVPMVLALRPYLHAADRSHQ